jgi:hypothetical protein
MRDLPGADPAMDARARGGQAVASLAPLVRAGQLKHGQVERRPSRVGDADPEPRVRTEAHRDVAIGIDDGDRMTIEEAEGTVRDPALGDPVEVETESCRATDHTTETASLERPGTRCRRGGCRAQRSLVEEALRRQSRVEQRDVDDPVGEPFC